jgi:hypothetical protein
MPGRLACCPADRAKHGRAAGPSSSVPVGPTCGACWAVADSALISPVRSRGRAADLFSPCSTTLAASLAPTCVGPACVEVPMPAVPFKRVPGGFLVAAPTGARPRNDGAGTATLEPRQPDWCMHATHEGKCSACQSASRSGLILPSITKTPGVLSTTQAFSGSRSESVRTVTARAP